MSDPHAEHKNFFCGLCKRRFASRPAARDHVFDHHPGRKVIISKYVETVFPDAVETINEDDEDDYE